VAAGVVLVIGCAAHAREPFGRARRRGARRIDGQPEVRQDLLDDRTVLDGRPVFESRSGIAASWRWYPVRETTDLAIAEVSLRSVPSRRSWGLHSLSICAKYEVP
jgi:hypothetical protein